MIIELSALTATDVYDSAGVKAGSVDKAIFHGRRAQLVGLQVAMPALVKKTAFLDFNDILSLDRREIVIDAKNKLQTSAQKDILELDQAVGKVVGVTAKTESGRTLGKIKDLYLDSESGLIVRFYLQHLLRERIIPRDFLVSITPKAIIFKDIVDQPIFDKVAENPAALA